MPLAPAARRLGAVLGVTLALGANADAALVVPAYNSLPTAAAKLFIDFDGVDYVGNWGSSGKAPGVVPAYSTDSDAANFSSRELTNIREIFLRVAEKYSPFKINVTTVDPGVYNNRETARVVVGGNGAWYSTSPVGGVAYLNSFSSSAVNTGWAFPANLGGGFPKYVAECIAHEAGHMFGLNHQSAFNASGVETQEYSTNGENPFRRPIMGSSYGSERGLWWRGTTTSATTIQDDLSVLSNASNAFGYRADDHGNTPEAARALTADVDWKIDVAGIIERTGDIDLFSFATGAGSVSFSLGLAEFGAMLDATLRLFTGEGALLRTVNSAELAESFTHALAAGDYLIGVSGSSDYGDLGQYRLTGQLVAVPEPMALAGAVGLLLLAGRRVRRA